MKKDVKEINGKMVYLTKGDVCKKCAVFDNETGDCLSGSNTECMSSDNYGKIWKLANPVQVRFQKVKAFFQDPFVKACIIMVLGILFFFFLLAGESIIDHFLNSIK